MQIECPLGGGYTLVTVTGSGGSGTICVRGSFTGFPDKNLTVTIRVRVLLGWVPPPPLPPAQPKQPGDVDVTPDGFGDWCAHNVPVGASSDAGTKLTAVAWVLTPDGSGGVTTSAPQSVQFYGGGPNPTDCCSGCSSDSGGMFAASELASAPALEVTVPDGPAAGVHRARSVAFLLWELIVGGATYQICAANGGGVILRRERSDSALASAVSTDPFSAVFSGEVLGAAGEVVVTIA